MLLATTLSLVASADAAGQDGVSAPERRHPAELLPVDATVRLVVEDTPATAARLGAFVRPVLDELDDPVRLKVSAGLLAVRAALGVGLGDAVGLVAPGPSALALVLEPRPGLLFASRGASRVDVEPLLEALPPPWVWRWDGGLLVVASDRALVDDAVAPASGAEIAARRFGSTAEPIRARIDTRRASRWARSRQRDGHPLVRLVAGPWLDAIARAEAAAVAMEIDDGRVAMRLALEGEGAPAEGEWSALVAGRGVAPLSLREGAGHLSLQRDLGVFFGSLDALLSPGQKVEVEGFLTLADTLLGHGATFEEAVIGALAGPPQLLLLEPGPAAEDPAPRLVLPGFALVAPLRADRAAGLRPVLQRSLNVIQLIANNERKQSGKDGALMMAASHVGAEGARVLRFDPWRGPGAPPTEWGLSPTLFVDRDHLVLCSTEAAAAAVWEALAAPRAAAPAGDRLEFSGRAVRRWLWTNLDFLAAGRVLDEGETLEEARQFFRTAAAVFGLVDRLAIEWDPARRALALELEGAHR